MKDLRQVLTESFADIYILTESDKEFIASFGVPDKPVSLAEFLKFWDSLDEQERTEIMVNYVYNGSTEGFKE
jgi:hypothetical protein